MKQKPKTSKTRWHQLLGKLLEELLVPVGVKVQTDFSVMSEPPKTDILLLRKEHRRWTKAQQKRLPDGVRDSRAKHILLEFKYTESVNENAFLQALCYDYLYRRTQHLKRHEVQTFLISSKTTRKPTLEKYGYFQSDKKGVYHSALPLLQFVPLISLNELSDELHNAYIKCFASRLKEKKSAFEALARKGFSTFSLGLQWVVEGLLHYWFGMQGEAMEIELTPEKVMKLGKKWQKLVLSGLKPEERLMGLGPEERLMGLGIEERLMGLEPEERLMGLGPEERLMGLGIEERLMGLEPEERLMGLSIKEIEAYLKKLKKKSGNRSDE